MSKSRKIKEPDDNDVVNPNREEHCRQDENDILLEFGHMSKQKKYSYNAFCEKAKTDKKLYKEFIELIASISSTSYVELQRRNKKQIGGIDPLPKGIFKCNICENLNKVITDEENLWSFYLGSEDKYRMIAYKSTGCKRALHIIGFDLDFSLYDHGS